MLDARFRVDVVDHPQLDPRPSSPEAAQFGAGDVGWKALGPSIGVSVLSTLVVSMRWYTRYRLVCHVGLDDWIILLALILSWTMCAPIGCEVNLGIGDFSAARHAVDTIMIAKLIVACNSVWSVTVSITKASILAQYLRIFDERGTRLRCWLLLAALVPMVCWAVLGGIFLCTPTGKLWDVRLPGRCRSAQSYWISVASVNIGLDFLTLFLPIPAIARLHLPRKQRVMTLLAFLLGFFVCVVSVIRLAMVLASSDQGDFVMSGIWSIIWSVVEANVGIVCASLPALKHLLVKTFPLLVDNSETPSFHNRLPKLQNIEQESTQQGSSAPVNLDCESPTSAQKISSSPMYGRESAGRPPKPQVAVHSHLRNDTIFDFAQMLQEDFHSSHRGVP